MKIKIELEDTFADIVRKASRGTKTSLDALGDAIVDLARQEPQRQADDAARMAEHPLDGEGDPGERALRRAH